MSVRCTWRDSTLSTRTEINAENTLLEQGVSQHLLLDKVELLLVMAVRWTCRHNKVSARTEITERVPFSISGSACSTASSTPCLSSSWSWSSAGPTKAQHAQRTHNNHGANTFLDQAVGLEREFSLARSVGGCVRLA